MSDVERKMKTPSVQGQNVLRDIVANKREEVAAIKSQSFERPQAYGPVRDFTQALRDKGTRFIFECKRKSPSEGLIRDGHIADFIDAYKGIADAISVLTDQRYFGGDLEDLRNARLACDRPLLRKDFIIDPVQVHEAYAHGADAVLLMLSVLDDADYRRCAAAAHERGLSILTEVHDEAELQRALKLDAAIIGINNRDLRSLAIDLQVTRRLAPQVGLHRLCISESGIRSHADVRALAPLVDGFLVGSSLMRSPHLAHAARELAFGPVKICGLTSEHDAIHAFESGAVYGGFIFSQRSPRCIDLPKALAISKAADLNYVGVFTDHDAEDIAAMAVILKLQAVQLHGDYSESDIQRLHERLPPAVAIWLVRRIATDQPTSVDDSAALHLRASGRSAMTLFDCAGPAPGGNGCRFDWSLLAQHADKSGLIVAGGLNPDNIIEADRLDVAMLDINSGVEAAPGQKSAQKLHSLFEQIRIGLQGK